MANRKQLAILKQGVEDWNNWRKNNPDVKINLKGADLFGAHLMGANLNGADLMKAKLTDCKIASTIFGNNDLSSSFGLEATDPLGASTLGTDTIRKSIGKIPLEFLRGCGLSDLEIESAKLAAPGLDPEQVTQI